MLCPRLWLQSEAAQLDRLRSDTAQAASQEAAVLGQLRGQVAELQNVLVGMGHQLTAEQGMRRADAQVRALWNPLSSERNECTRVCVRSVALDPEFPPDPRPLIRRSRPTCAAWRRRCRPRKRASSTAPSP